MLELGSFDGMPEMRLRRKVSLPEDVSLLVTVDIALKSLSDRSANKGWLEMGLIDEQAQEALLH